MAMVSWRRKSYSTPKLEYAVWRRSEQHVVRPHPCTVVVVTISEDGGFLEIPCFHCEDAIYANKEEYYTHYAHRVLDWIVWLYPGMLRCGAHHASAASKSILQEANKLHRFSCIKEKKFTTVEIVHICIQSYEMEYVEERAIRESLEEVAGPRAMKPASAKSVNNLMERKVSESSWTTSECVICMDDIDTCRRSVTMDCGHVLYENCFAQWLNRSHVCPLCRYKIFTDNV